MQAPLEPGTTVGRHVVEELVGAGGMGVVYAARDAHLNRRVALKLMTAHLAEDPVFRERFAREAAVLGQLDSPHIVQVYDHGELDGHPWIATQFVEGGDLARLIARNGPLPTPLALELCAQVADGLHDAHGRGIVHRDVKPENILVADAGTDRPHAYLTDFGLAREVGAELTAVRSTTGTWDYLAPECGSGSPATVASDVYAVGGLLWTCLTGQPPYAGTPIEVALAHARQPPPALAPGPDPRASAALNAVIARAMSKDPRGRPGSAAQLSRELRAIADGRPVPTGRRNRRGLLVGAALAVLVVGGIVAAVTLTGDDAPTAGERGDQSPSPSPSSSPTAAEPVERPITGDIDGDGHGDLLVVKLADDGNDVDVMRSTGDRSLGDLSSYAVRVGEAVTGDLNGDGLDELVSVKPAGTRAPQWRIDVVRDGATGVETTDLKAPPGTSNLYASLGDFNGDGRDDLAIISDGSLPDKEGVWVSLSGDEGLGPLRRWYSFVDNDEGDAAQRVVAGDFDGDGDDDAAFHVSSNRLQLLVSDGSSFTRTGEPAVEVPFRLATGDFDGNGTDELLGYSLSGSALVEYTYGEDGWEDDIVLELDPELERKGISAPVVADFNGDRRDDVLSVTGNYQDPSYDLQVALSNGLGFESETPWATLPNEPNTFPVPVGPTRVD